tara:strand:- start:43 stop:603 length:561 start_codon:yes stop_codon:yes gene_type:complete
LKTKSLNINKSVEWLKSGKILAHPTESIWGLGCDAFNEKAVNFIFKIKKRDKNKNFILLVNSLESFKKYLKEIKNEDRVFLNKYWPGPHTFLINYNDNLPTHLHNESGKIAIRVSNHLPIQQLLNSFSGFIVSTSANISGKENINDPHEIMNSFEYKEMAYYDEMLGSNKSPSTIIDLESRSIIRA